VIFISIDDGEVAQLRKICDEVFGEENFVANVMWQKRTSPDSRLNLGPAHDFIIVYAKFLEPLKESLNKLELSEDRSSQYKNPDNDSRGVWASVDITGQTGHATASQFYEITTPSGSKMKPPAGRCWALAESTFIDLVSDGRIWFGEDGSSRPRKKLFLSESEGGNAWTWWTNTEVGHNQEASKEIKELLGQGDIFPNPKPTRLIKRILILGTSKNNSDIILDFFSGSATTAHAVMQLNAEDGGNRKFIMVQLPEPCDEQGEAFNAGYKNICEIGKERIRRAGNKIKADAGLNGQNLDIGFRILKVADSNMKDVYYTAGEYKQENLDMFVSNIKEDRTPLD
jgi:adenine-specific DNA-methyltransferase